MANNVIGEFEIRSLKRKEVKALKEKGFNMGALQPEQIDDFMDAVFTIIYSPAHIGKIDEQPQRDCIKLLNQIMDETNGSISEVEAKNS